MKKENGFTLIESMIAVALIVSGLTGILTLINRAFGFSNNAFNRLTAANLAQEGIELVRNTRDNNWLNRRAWDFGLADDGCGGPYQADYKEGLKCHNGQPLLFDENIGYNNTEGKVSFFERKLFIQHISSNEIKITVIVSWKARGASFETVVEDHLYNWL